jgi:hypothetical protein
MDAMPLVETTALVIAVVIAGVVADRLVPSVAKANPLQWAIAVATVVKTNAIAVLVIAKALVMAVAFLDLREDNLHFGWEVRVNTFPNLSKL